MIARLLRYFSLFPAVALLAACASDYVAREPVSVDYGTVEAIQIYRGSDNQLVNVGTVLGGIAGGVIGHQIGSGTGNTVATIAGAVGGAVVGHAIEDKVHGSRYRITVRLDSGSTLVVEEDARDVELRVGDRVRVEGNHVYRQ